MSEVLQKLQLIKFDCKHRTRGKVPGMTGWDGYEREARMHTVYIQNVISSRKDVNQSVVTDERASVYH